MKAKIFSHDILIGTAELQLGDESMGCLYGMFSPTNDYYKHVQKVVWKFWSTNKPNYIKWASMNFNVQLDNGCFLFAVGGLTIDDVQELQTEAKRIDIAGVDRHVIEDFFLSIEPRPFVVEPWEPISIAQKIAFETELNKEIGIHRDKLFFGSSNKHILSDFDISALCHSRNDDVLFMTRKRNCAKEFAIVHLTWTGMQEEDNYPRVEFYDTFDEFKYYRMYPDKAEWEY